jgi:hypothetical protein
MSRENRCCFFKVPLSKLSVYFEQVSETTGRPLVSAFKMLKEYSWSKFEAGW